MSNESTKAALIKSDEQGAVAKQQTFPAMLEKFKGEIARALPAHMNADRMARIALTAFRNSPQLANCDPRSIFGAVIQSSQLGLEIGLMGEAHLVPFSKSSRVGNDWVKTYEAQLIPGYQGLIKLARNSGLVKDIYAHEVREKDKFKVVLGLERTLMHEPLEKNGFPAGEDERGAITGFYAVAVFKDGTHSFIAMPVDQILKIRDKSSGYIAAVSNAKKYNKDVNSPWVTDFVAMGLKTVIRALCKWMPKSPELAAAIALDTASERGQAQNNDPKDIIEGTWTVPNVEDEPETVKPETKPTAEPEPKQETAKPTADPFEQEPEQEPEKKPEPPKQRPVSRQRNTPSSLD